MNKVLKKGDGTILISKKEAYPGQLILTDKHLIFVRDHTKLFLYSILIKEVKGAVMMTLSLNEIKSFSKTRYGLSFRILKLELHDGREFKIILKERYKVWEKELEKVINKSVD